MKNKINKIIIVGIILLSGLMSLTGCSLDSENVENISTPENTVDESNSTTTEKIAYLKDSDGKDFFETALCGVAQLTVTEGTVMEDYISYTSENSKYSVEVKTNKDNKITYVKMIALTSEDSTNFFMAANRMTYEGRKSGDLTNFIVKQKGKESTTEIGGATFKFSIGENKQTILEIFAN